MSDNKCRDMRDFSRFDSMSTGELQQILRQDALQEGVDADTEMILYITEVLAKRKKQKDPSTDVQRAYRSFVQNYMPASEPETPILKKTTSFFSRIPQWLRSAAVLAVVLGLLLAGTAGANAMGYDLLGMIAHWTADVFHFSDPTDGTEYTEPVVDEELPYESLQDALNRYRIEQRLAPTWLPDGYEFAEVEVLNNPFERSFYAIYNKDEIYIQISVRQLIGEVPEQIEKNEDFIEVYEVGGVAYYLFQNTDYTQVVWTIGEFEGVIAGDLTIEEAKAMIDSI